MRKKRIIAIVEAKQPGFVIYCERLPAISSYGETIEDAKRNIKDKVETILTRHDQKRTQPPLLLNDGQLTWVYRYDVESILGNFPALDTTSFVRNLRLHPSLMYQYKTGITLATERQVRKLTAGLHDLGRKLLRVQF